jgi:amidophosphoribosyltransferase
VVALIAGHGLLAFRDPFGIRPLCFGESVGSDGGEVMVASESVALEGTGHKLVRDVAPGEAIFIDLEGQLHSRQCAEHPTLNPCMFEYVYLARPDSIMDGVSVDQARLNMGETLAQRLISTMPPNEIDVVIPIPESSRPSAMQLAQKIGKPYREGFVKNRYVGRTFIMPGQGVRKKSVRQKLNAIGIDMPTKDELIAHNRSIEEIRQFIGADALIYQDVAAMKRVVSQLNPKLDGFEASCFDGNYITGDVSAADFDAIATQRSSQGNDEEDGPDRSRLALQGVVHDGR